MPATEINVSYRSGSAAKGYRVMLSMHGGGVTDTVRTDGSGRAIVQHSSSGTADIFVDGNRVARGVRVPGRFAFTV